MNRYERLNQKQKAVTTKKKVAAYCRVSTDGEDQANSFESQKRYFRQYIERNPDWELYEIFADEGISGTNTRKRNAFNRMIACAKNGDFDLIITKEISRFARNTLDSIYYTRDLKKHGIGVIFLNDNIHTLDSDAELRLAILSSIAQEESRKTSERVKWGQKRRMEQGVVFGRDLLGYDVRGGKLYINEEGAKIVRLIFHKFVDERKGTHVIARELREEGIPPCRGKEWQHTVILRILRNEKYCGDLVQKKTYTPDFLSHEKKYNRGQEEFVILKDHHEPIVSRELFDEANRILDERSRTAAGKARYCHPAAPNTEDERSCTVAGKIRYSSRHTFSGKIRCGQCGHSYVARYKTRRDGSRYRAWRCLEAVRNGPPRSDSAGSPAGCASPGIRNEDAVHLMCLVTKALRFDRSKFQDRLLSVIRTAIATDAGGADTEKRKARIQAIENKRARLIELYLAGDVTKEEFTAASAKCDSEIAGLQPDTAKMERQPAQPPRKQQELIRAMDGAVSELLNGVEYEDTFYRQILDQMVVIDRDHIDVYLHFLPVKWSYTAAGCGNAPRRRPAQPKKSP